MKAKKTEGVIAGVFITLEKEHWTPEMRKVAKEAGKFKHPHSARQFPRLQHWHIKRADLRAREETMFQGLPDLPKIAHPGTGKPLILKQERVGASLNHARRLRGLVFQRDAKSVLS